MQTLSFICHTCTLLFPYEYLLLTPLPVCPLLSMVLINQLLLHLYPVLYVYRHHLPHIYKVL